VTATINLITEQELTPTAIDVFKRAKQEALGDTPLELVVNDEDVTPRLVLGKGEGDVTTLSVKQIVNKETAVTDLAIALRNVLNLPQQEEIQYEVIKDYGPLDRLGPVVMFDIEVAGDIETDLPSETPIISMAFSDGQNIFVVPEELCEGDPHGTIVSILKSRTIVGHNARFDMRTVSDRLNNGEQIYPDHDTMLMHYAMNHGAKMHGLKQLAQKLFNAPEWEHDLKKYTKGGAHYENIPRDLLYKYNAGDVYWTGKLFNLFRDQLENDPPRRKLYLDHLMPLDHMYQDIESGGIPVDEEYFKRLSAELGEKSQGLLDQMRSIVEDEKFNPGSWQQVKKYIEGEIGKTIPSTDEKTLTQVRASQEEGSAAHTFISALLDYRGTTKLRSTYAEGTLSRSRNGAVYPQFLLHGTTTGRTSSKSPNVQNQPRGPVTRTGFVASSPDHVVLSVDYSQIELRTLAELSNDEAMIAAFQPGAVDYFDAMMPGTNPDKFVDVESFYLYKEANPAEAKELRAQVKGVQYGLNYGRGVKAIAEELGLTIEDTEGLIQGIFDTYPGLKEWQDKVKRAVVDPSLSYMLTTPFNRRFQSEVVTSRNRNAVENAAMAFVPQSTASDITQSAALQIHKRVGQFDTRIVATIHDAIVFDVPIDKVDDVIKMAETEMVGAAASVFHRVEFSTEAEVGRSWADV